MTMIYSCSNECMKKRDEIKYEREKVEKRSETLRMLHFCV